MNLATWYPFFATCQFAVMDFSNLFRNKQWKPTIPFFTLIQFMYGIAWRRMLEVHSHDLFSCESDR